MAEGVLYNATRVVIADGFVLLQFAVFELRLVTCLPRCNSVHFASAHRVASIEIYMISPYTHVDDCHPRF